MYFLENINKLRVHKHVTHIDRKVCEIYVKIHIKIQTSQNIGGEQANIEIFLTKNDAFCTENGNRRNLKFQDVYQ